LEVIGEFKGSLRELQQFFADWVGMVCISVFISRYFIVSIVVQGKEAITRLGKKTSLMMQIIGRHFYQFL